MDNNLSKPVAWTDAEELRDLSKYRCAYMFIIDTANPYHDPRRQLMLYSQEYVTALIAEAQQQGRLACGIFDENKILHHRIAELEERLNLVREQRDNELRTNSELEKQSATPVRFPNEDAASAMFDIFYQTERNNHGNVQLGFSDAKALGEWIAKALELRAIGVKCEVGQ